MLPKVFPYLPEREEFDLYALMRPAREVGGDFYDFFMVDEDHLAIVIGDVSDKGIPAALFMVVSKTLIKNYAQARMLPDVVFTRANNELCEDNRASLFTTAWLGVYEISTGTLLFADAGHDNPLIRRVDGSVATLAPERKQLFLGGFEGVEYRLNTTVLRPGEKLLLYTDGVPEATAADQRMYGAARLTEALGHSGGGAVQTLLHAIVDDVGRFVADAPQSDDLTMLALGIREGSPAALTAELVVTPQEGNTAVVLDKTEHILESWGIPPKTIHGFLIASDEIFSNIVKYSNAHEVEVVLRFRDGVLHQEFRDDGMPFDPLQEAPEPDLVANVETRSIGGLGILLVKKMMDYCTYRYDSARNIVAYGKTSERT
jgi:sigma-B regulation protein RsbU (phosphoserine phosphatase)